MKILIHFFILQLSAAEIFTSSAHVESLINANKEVPQMLENYINMEGIRVQTLRRSILFCYWYIYLLYESRI